MSVVEKAIEIATRAHAGVLDKGGVPYIYHPLAVASQVTKRGEDVEAAAILHDVVEDTHLSLRDLSREGMPDRVLFLVEGMTHIKGQETYFEYIDRIISSGDVDLMLIKRADVMHNMSKRPGDFVIPASLLDRYAKTLAKIYDALIELGYEDV